MLGIVRFYWEDSGHMTAQVPCWGKKKAHSKFLLNLLQNYSSVLANLVEIVRHRILVQKEKHTRQLKRKLTTI